MTDRKASIAALLSHSEKALQKIETEYNASLANQTIAAELKIDIKNFCENLRSVLDYLAHEIRYSHCPTAKPKDRFYFPILPDHKSFETQVAKWYPGLDINQPDVWNYLESIQPYQAGYEWLGSFSLLNNENKHADLVEQTRTESREVRVKLNSGEVRWNPSGVRFGGGVFIGRVPVDPRTQMPVPHPSQKVERIVWVDFQFAALNVSALNLLKQSLEGIKKMASDVHRWI